MDSIFDNVGYSDWSSGIDVCGVNGIDDFWGKRLPSVSFALIIVIIKLLGIGVCTTKANVFTGIYQGKREVQTLYSGRYT